MGGFGFERGRRISGARVEFMTIFLLVFDCRLGEKFERGLFS